MPPPPRVHPPPRELLARSTAFTASPDSTLTERARPSCRLSCHDNHITSDVAQML